jgi:hypothetical protein
MIQRCKNPIVAFPVIMQSFDKHLPLRREMVVGRYPDVLIYLLKTVFTQTIKISLRQESGRTGRDRHHAALAVGDVTHLARKRLVTPGAIFFFVFVHQAMGSFTVSLSCFAAATIAINAAFVSGQFRVFSPQSGLTHN